MRHATSLIDLVVGHVQGDVICFLIGVHHHAQAREAQPHGRSCLAGNMGSAPLEFDLLQSEVNLKF